ncbi:hypothetical protein A5789_28490 [Nocardia sp. 852002-51101_SCH5132738]|nr:hypothetical protein A5789_28490 [Nocardia sp. 852002-51101_SCH5132738]OBB49764.1 hypothetical protein A5748_19205 [Nocardia sp. 852002-51244_SCH5132740]OBF63585.1 hypothetical protein A9X06_10115 [Mycobacterium sp. 852002-51759_SCH5129042]
MGLVIELIADAAEALDYTHAHGVLHRDVKLASLLIERDSPHGLHALLTDSRRTSDTEPIDECPRTSRPLPLDSHQQPRTRRSRRFAGQNQPVISSIDSMRSIRK